MGTQLPTHRAAQTPQFSVHICCGQMAGWIKMLLVREVGLSPSDIVLDGDPAPPKKGHSPPILGLCLLDQTAGWINMVLGTEVCFGAGHIVLDGDPAPSPEKGHSFPQFLAHVCCGQTAGWIKMPLGIMEVGLVPGHIVLDGDPAPPPKKGHSPHFRLMFIVAKWLDG